MAEKKTKAWSGLKSCSRAHCKLCGKPLGRTPIHSVNYGIVDSKCLRDNKKKGAWGKKKRSK